MAGRARRTRVYDCNYNMGQQYYKSALDELDRKNQPAPVKREPIESLLSRPKYNVDEMLSEDLNTARKRADLALLSGAADDSYYDSRGARIPKSSLAGSLDEDFDEEVQSSLNRIRANKQLTSSAFNNKELEIEDTINKVKRRARLDLGEKLMESAGDNEASDSIRRRALKMVTRASDDFIDPKSLTKWTALSSGGDDSSSLSQQAASQRAKATKVRLAELENDMFERSEKQAARENRSAQLKRFMESNIESSSAMMSSSSNNSSSHKSEKHVNF